jgi:hypothetical protein
MKRHLGIKVPYTPRYYPKAQIRQGAGWDGSEVSGFCTL